MTLPPFISAVDADGIGLRVDFQRERDRYLHRIRLLDGDDGRDLLASIEGTDAEPWPPSPPFQQLSIERRPAGSVALLVGMAGKNHWSASIEADSAARRIVFDVACRVKESGGPLGSVYKMAAPARLDATSQFVQWRLGRRTVQFAVDTPSSSASRMTIADERLCILPTQDYQPPHTMRWRYSAQVLQTDMHWSRKG